MQQNELSILSVQKTREETPLEINPIFETNPYVFNYVFMVRISVERGEVPSPKLVASTRAEIRGGWMWRNNGPSCIVHLAC